MKSSDDVRVRLERETEHDPNGGCWLWSGGQGAGPSGVILAALAAAWKQWRDEAARHAEERAKMREAMAALEHRVDLEATKTAAALERIRDLIAVAEAAARSRQ